MKTILRFILGRVRYFFLQLQNPIAAVPVRGTQLRFSRDIDFSVGIHHRYFGNYITIQLYKSIGVFCFV